MRGGMVVVFAFALVAAACGDDGTSREDARSELVEAGFTEATADCILDSLEEAGFEPSDFDRSPSADADAAMQAAVMGCMSGVDADGVMGEGAVREMFITELSSEAGLTPAQAECVYDELEQLGVNVVDAFLQETNIDAEITEALQACR